MGWIEYEPDQYNKGMAKAAWEVAMEEAQKAGMGTFVKAHQIRPRGKSITSGYVLVPVDSIEKAIQSAVLEFGRPNITATSVKRFAIEYAKRIKEPSDA